MQHTPRKPWTDKAQGIGELPCHLPEHECVIVSKHCVSTSHARGYLIYPKLLGEAVIISSE